MDEKDLERQQKRISEGITVNHYSMTIMNEESHAHINEMTGLLNETV